MFSSRPLQSPHCVMALKHVNQKAARCCWRQIVVTPLVPKQNAAGGPKVVTLTPLRSSAHRNAANGWCGSSLLLCLTHCIEVHDSYWIHGQILWQISHWDHKTWVNSTCDSISLRSTEYNVVASKWHSSHLDTRLAKSCMFGQFFFMAPCVRMAPSTPGSRRESPQKWKEWSTTSIILQKGAFLIPSPLAGGLSELPDRKHAASIHAQKWSDRSSAISNVGVATICLVFFNLQPKALRRLKKNKQKNRGQAKIEFSQQQLSFVNFLSHQSSSLTC